MSYLNRYYAQNAARVWELEARWMRAAGTFRAPAAVQWIATRACDLTCDHCYSDAGPRNPDELTTDEALAMVDAIAKTGCDQLVIAGGEPLLRKDLDVIVARTAEKGVRWALHTHGGLVKRRLDLFRDTPPAMVAVSLDGPPAVHDRIRGREGAFQDALEAMELLAELGVKSVVAGTTVNALNADHLADLEPYVRASAAHSWGLHLFAPEGRGAVHRALLPSPGQLARVAAFCQRKRSTIEVDLDNEWGSAGELDPLYRDEPFLCGAGRFTMVIAANGDIMPCTTTDPAEAEGNVRTDALPVVWRDGFGRFRGEGTDAACADGQDCWLQTRNGNSCRESAFGVRPTPTVVPDLPPPPPTRSRRASGALRWAAVLALATASAPAAAAEPTENTLCASEPMPLWEPGAWARIRRGSYWDELREKTALGRRPGSSEIERALAAGPPLSEEQLLSALDRIEQGQIFDPFVVARLWQRMPDKPGKVPARLARHSRMAFALKMAVADAGQVEYLPWRKKSAPPRGYEGANVPSGFDDALKKHWDAGDRSSWATEATLEVSVVGGDATLCRAGKRLEIEAGARLRLGRLDVLELAPGAKVVHSTHGDLATGGVVHPHTLSARMPSKARASVEILVRTALEGDAAAVDRTATVLALAQGPIRVGVAENPDAPGAAALRQLLVLWDE